MFLLYVLSFFKKGDIVQGGTLFKEIRYILQAQVAQKIFFNTDFFPSWVVHDPSALVIVVFVPAKMYLYFDLISLIIIPQIPKIQHV